MWPWLRSGPTVAGDRTRRHCVGNDGAMDSSLNNVLAFLESLYLAEIVHSEVEILNL
jgi:hypothetical protein